MPKDEPRLKQWVHSHPFEYAMGMLAALTALLFVSEFYAQNEAWSAFVLQVDHVIITVFALEYLIKFYYAERKWAFIRSHWLELLALIPFSLVFQSLRLLRLVRVVLLLRVSFVHLKRLLMRNTLLYVSFLTASIVIIAALLVFWLEREGQVDGIASIGDALWWSWVTVTTVGYGDLTPKTAEGRIVAAVLMLVGISFLGVLTGTVASFLMRTLETADSFQDAALRAVMHKIRELPTLRREEIDDIHRVLVALWESEQQRRQQKNGDHP